jgi:hypothetical protein
MLLEPGATCNVIGRQQSDISRHSPVSLRIGTIRLLAGNFQCKARAIGIGH